MNFTTRFSQIILKNLRNQSFKQTKYHKIVTPKYTQPAVIYFRSSSRWHNTGKSLPTIGILFGFNLFKSKDDEETPEDKLIMTIKRSILSIQRKEYDKAEQLLHVALRMAQDLQHRNGVTYVFDVLANLAMERGHFKNAEKLFTDVMKRLFADGETEDSLKIIHMSSKIAHMAHLQENFEKAAQGFNWALEKLRNLPDSEDVREIKAITCDWFGQMLVEQGNYKEAMKHFKEAYEIFMEQYGETFSELVPILNNLSVSALGLNDSKSAMEYIKQALELLKKLPDATGEGVLQANLGLIYLKDGLLQQAKSTCSYAYKLGKKLKDEDSVEQANYCLDEVKKAMKE